MSEKRMSDESRTLEVTTPSDREIVLTRVFDAPRDLVFAAFTEPELLLRWGLGPPGWVMVVCEIDLRIGGKWRFVVRGPEGTEMGMGGVYLDVRPPERLVATELFDHSWYEGEAISTLTLMEKDGKTTLTNRIVYQSTEIRDAVLRTPMADGVAAGYNRLAEILAAGPAPANLSEEAQSRLHQSKI
jgi:uncharacterized protein YndB with AHSA1/START domain